MTEGLEIISKRVFDTVDAIIARSFIKTLDECEDASEYLAQVTIATVEELAELAGAVFAACTSVDALDLAETIKGYYTPRKITTSADGKTTVVFWEDGKKTIVRLSEGDTPNAQNAFTNALAKKIFGSNSQIKRIIEAKTEVQKPEKKKKHTLPESTLSTSAPTPAESKLSHIVDYGCDN